MAWLRRMSLVMIVLLASCSINVANAGGDKDPRVQHKQLLHQKIVEEAFKILSAEFPRLAARLVNHVGDEGFGSEPWEAKTISAGSYREDVEDIVYGYGGPDFSKDPDIDISKGSCLDGIYHSVEGQIRNDPDFRSGLVSSTHFWDENASDRFLRKTGIVISATFPLGCLSTTDFQITIKPEATAWDKIVRILRPNGEAIRDYWWTPSEVFVNVNPALNITLPSPRNNVPLRIAYSTLTDLYNTGECSIKFGDGNPVSGYVLTPEQRDTYVWEMLGRACHLLTDMSVPAHVHKDIHSGNQVIFSPGFLGMADVTITWWDADSYEQWVSHAGSGQTGDLTRLYWDAINVTEWSIQHSTLPYIDTRNDPDPIYSLMYGLRTIAASFASDDYDGTGGLGLPVSYNDFPTRYNDDLQPSLEQVEILTNIRDATVPQCIRAVAGLLLWFADDLQNEQHFLVTQVGGDFPGYYYRPTPTSAFPQTVESWNTGYSINFGDLLSIRSESSLSATEKKLGFWSSEQHTATGMHENDFIIHENQSDINASYMQASVTTVPSIGVVMEDALVPPVSTAELFFKNPWYVDPSQSDAYALHQPDEFQRCIQINPTPAQQPLSFDALFAPNAINNGGVLLEMGDDQNLRPPYYSIRAAKTLDYESMAEKASELEVGDWMFQGWTSSQATLVGDPQSYPNPSLYSTKALIFNANNAEVRAQYKGHLTTTDPYSTTSSECSTCPNSQRKLSWISSQAGTTSGSTGLYELVYTSGGKIWYTQSTDMGQGWNREYFLSDGYRPHITTGENASYISYYHQDDIFTKKMSSGSAIETYDVGLFTNPSDDAAPVNACNEADEIVAVVYEKDDGSIGYQVYWKDQLEQTGAIPGSGASGTAVRPTIANPGNATAFYVAWREGGNILYTEMHISGSNQFFMTVDPGTVISNAWQTAEQAPSISFDSQRYPAVAWTSADPLHGTYISFRQRTSGGWGTMASMLANPGDAYWAPSVLGVSNNLQSHDLRIAHNTIHGTSGVMALESGTWLVPTSVQSNGQLHPNTVISAPSARVLQVGSMPSQPFMNELREFVFTDEHLAKTNSMNSFASSRELVFGKDSSQCTYRFGEIKVSQGQNDDVIAWATGYDTLIVGLTKSIEQYTRTSAFNVSNGATLSCRIARERRGTAVLPTGLTLTVEVMDALTDQPLGNINTTSLQAMSQGRTDARFVFPLHAYVGRMVYLRLAPAGLDSTIRLTAIDYYHDPSMVLPRAVGEEEVTIIVPEKVILHQNHPNPFNPYTEITYTLPMRMPVQVSVMDLAGRELMVLEQGERGPGIHRVKVDASGLPSGTYMYRLVHPNGLEVKKMVLLK